MEVSAKNLQTFLVGSSTTQGIQNGNTVAQNGNRPSEALRCHLHRRYLRQPQNRMPRGGDPTHLTIFVYMPGAKVLRRNRRTTIIGCSSTPVTIHIVDIAAASFTVEIRNIPLSAAVERLLLRISGEIDRGQTHTTARFTLRPSDGRLLRSLAHHIRRVPCEQPIGESCATGFASFVVYRALRELADVLDEFQSISPERAVVTDVGELERDLLAKYVHPPIHVIR